ncbi:MAG: DUF4410 domain-containing protein [Planctomycetota bacterium]|jgi:hypothetical protein
MFYTHIVALATAAVLAVGCATARVEARDTAEGGPPPKPPVLLVYDFAVNLEDVDADSWGMNAASSSPTTISRRELAERITRAFSESLAGELTGRGIPARRAVATTPVPLYAVQLQGVFLAIDEGDEVVRTVVGFGKGASRVEARLRAYQRTSSGNRLLGTATMEAAGSRKPGVAVSGASAAITGGVTGLIFSGAMKVADKTGADDPLPNEVKEGIRADVVRAARKVADLIQEKYQERAWL